MQTIPTLHRTVLFLLLAGLVLGSAALAQPRTLRLDYYHTGDHQTEIFSFDRLVVEPLPWPGNPDRPFDLARPGKYFFELFDAESGALLYSRGFASIYGEWETTGEARERRRTFHESLRFPAHGDAPLRLVLHKRGADQRFAPVWETELDPQDIFVDTSLPAMRDVLTFEHNGPSAHKVDLLLLGDGYTAAELDRFERDAQRLVDTLFGHAPFRERREDFNVWGICPPASRSGVSRPSTGVHLRSPVGATYDAFGSERYVLSFENRALREIAAWAPYDFVVILANSETYGGGGILGLYATVAAANDWAPYLFIHEFGHHFAGLADEYYTSSVAYEEPEALVEPWEANITAHPAPLKWAALASAGAAIPTPWPKQAFEEHAAEIQERRRRIRAEQRPEKEMSALFHEQREIETELLGGDPNAGVLGAFEGAGYMARGLYRPQIDCIMFSRNEVPFCGVCARALEDVIDLYTASSPLPSAESTVSQDTP